MPHLRVLPLLLPLALAATAVTMYAAAASERRTATQAADRTDAAARLLTSLLDQETGLRGFLLVGRTQFLEPFVSGRARTETTEREIRNDAHGDRPTLELMRRHEALHLAWLRLADEQIAAKRRSAGDVGSIAAALERKNIMDQLRAVNGAVQGRLTERRNAELRASGDRAIVFVVLVTAIFGLGTFVGVRREARKRREQYRAEIDYRASQREYSDIVQVVRSEPEAHTLLKRHLELSLPGAHATVLSRNNSDNRLEATTGIGATSVLADGVGDVDPNTCVAVRLGRSHRDLAGDDQLLTCGVCGAAPGRTACEPLLVGGQVIGAVLVEHAGDLGEHGERRVTDSVAQAAPVLANLRNLALAERRASTDALTGLPNRRGVQDTLKRMSAHATRGGQPLAAISLDLDRFKDINDRFGHEMGDTVLAHVAALLTTTLRTSDFVGRLGGEEFVVLAPDTGVEGARTLAENLRVALERDPVAGLDRDVTASFGVAVLPDHTADGDVLLRLSDRALYAAKAAGRNRVEVAGSTTPETV